MLKLVQTDWGVFDLEVDDPANSDADAAVATLVYATLYTDAEAPLDRVDDSYDRRGWYADSTAGSGLWHVRRQALSDNARREALSMVRTALMRSSAITDLDVNEITPDDATGSVSSVFIEVTGFHNGRKFLVRAPL